MSVRLTEEEKIQIKAQVKKIFGEKSRVYLFGSRVDGDKKGGDIDLFVEPQTLEDEFKQKMILLTKLQLLLGDQKIDVVLATDPLRPIEQEARKKGKLL
jgi:predicted nucleotidyltransferase